MFNYIKFHEEANLSKKIKKNLNKKSNYFSVPKNGYFWVRGVDLVQEDNSIKNISDVPYLLEKPTETADYKKLIPKDKEKYIFWEFGHLEYSPLISESKINSKVKKQIIDFANKYGSLTKGVKLLSSEYSINYNEQENNNSPYWAKNINKGIKITDRIYFPIYGEPLSFWIIEIMKMKSLILLWKAIIGENIDENMDILNKIIKWKKDKIYYVLTPSFERLEKARKNNQHQNNNSDDLIEGKKISADVNGSAFISGVLAESKSGDKNQYINSDKFVEFEKGEVLEPAKFLLKRLVRNITKEVFFDSYKNIKSSINSPINFNPNKIDILPNNLLSYMWYEFYQLTQEDVEIKWCSLCGGPEDFSKKRSDWKNHRICISRFHQKKHQDLKLYKENDDIKEEDIVERWKDNPWNINITINDVKEWISKKEEDKKENK